MRIPVTVGEATEASEDGNVLERLLVGHMFDGQWHTEPVFGPADFVDEDGFPKHTKGHLHRHPLGTEYTELAGVDALHGLLVGARAPIAERAPAVEDAGDGARAAAELAAADLHFREERARAELKAQQASQAQRDELDAAVRAANEADANAADAEARKRRAAAAHHHAPKKAPPPAMTFTPDPGVPWSDWLARFAEIARPAPPAESGTSAEESQALAKQIQERSELEAFTRRMAEKAQGYLGKKLAIGAELTEAERYNLREHGDKDDSREPSEADKVAEKVLMHAPARRSGASGASDEELDPNDPRWQVRDGKWAAGTPLPPQSKSPSAVDAIRAVTSAAKAYTTPVTAIANLISSVTDEATGKRRAHDRAAAKREAHRHAESVAAQRRAQSAEANRTKSAAEAEANRHAETVSARADAAAAERAHQKEQAERRREERALAAAEKQKAEESKKNERFAFIGAGLVALGIGAYAFSGGKRT